MANVRVIPAILPAVSAQTNNSAAIRRVAAYARVSTDSEEQQTSYVAQVDHYTKFIQTQPHWKLAGVYTDEGISALNTRKRDGFNRMVSDALAGGIDLIVTKSVSRFARNTVDSLTTVRKLKEKGVEVWFEKENIFTLDSKGELLITIMSSLAQEESRSISENVTWGQRKRMADGKVSLPYKQFLGYEKGEDGLPHIVEKEAAIVRRIFRQYMEGKTSSTIARLLEKDGIPAPAGGRIWQSATVRSILTNEKYKGHALMQKTYCADFLTKKMVKNTGQVQQYYVEDSHPAIIHPDEFDAVQVEYECRKALGKPGRCAGLLAGKIICGECGGMYGRKVWGSYQNDKSRRRVIYRCDDKYKSGHTCKTPHLTEEQIKDGFVSAFNSLLDDRKDLLEDCRLAQATLCDTEAIDAELARLRQELEVVAELSRKEIHRKAHSLENPEESVSQGYLERYRLAKELMETLEKERLKRTAKSKTIGRFIRSIRGTSVLLTQFDETLWLAIIDSVTVTKAGGMVFRFKNGSDITI
jgi:site-specific DNA recombinase